MHVLRAQARMPSPSAWGRCGGTIRASTLATSLSFASRAASRSAEGPCPRSSELELRSGPLQEELEALAADGVQSLLLEGGPTLAAAFLEKDLVDKLLVFVAPMLSGEGSGMLAGLQGPLELSRLEARAIGEDVLLQSYVHEP